MNFKSWLRVSAVAICLSVPLLAGTFGKPVALGGHASDLALDEARGVLYVANYTRNQIQVMSLASNTLQDAINVAPQPSGISLSPDGRYLVVVHFANFAKPLTPANALTVIDLASRQQTLYSLADPPLGVGFGVDGRALVVTTTSFVSFDPATGTSTPIDTIANSVAKTLPVNAGTFPPTIKQASVAVSADGLHINGFGDGLAFQYDVASKKVQIVVGSTLPPSPRVASVNRDGSFWIASVYMVNGRTGRFIDQFASVSAQLDIGTTAWDDRRGLLYAQLPEEGSTARSAPLLKILDSANLGVRELIQLPENLTGRSVITLDGATMYSVSDSGIMVLPVGSLNSYPRVVAAQTDLTFRSSLCDRNAAVQTLTIRDLSGGNTPFALTPSIAGVRISPVSGITPATVRVSVDPVSFQGRVGTLTGLIQVSADGINVPPPIRVIVNAKNPDQRGTFVPVPGTLSDLLADPVRDRFYVTRKNTNEVLVFNANTLGQVATLRTRNTPVQMAVSRDGRYLLVANYDAQLISVFDLETLQETQPIQLNGFIAHTIAVSNNAILAAGRDYKSIGRIVKLDLATRTSSQPLALGIYDNTVSTKVYMSSSPSGESILIAQADGNLLLYSAQQDTFVAARQDSKALSGAIAASDGGSFAVGNMLYNASLVPVLPLDGLAGTSSGFAFVGDGAIRIGAPDSASAGVLQRLNLQTGTTLKSVRSIEAPLLSTAAFPFTHTLAPLSNGKGIVVLSTSGFFVVNSNYDDPISPPRLDRIVNAADFTKPVGPGGLISVFGANLNPLTVSSSQTSSDAIADSCMQVNGASIPVLFVSGNQVNAQLPNLDGNTTMKLITPGGVSDNFNLTISPTAPSVFRLSSSAGASAAIIRAANNQLISDANPVHIGDVLSIYTTGMGLTVPEVQPGTPAPDDQLTSLSIPAVVTLGGAPMDVLFAGLAPGQIGVYQVNVRVGENAPVSDAAPLEIKQGAGATALTVRVVQ